MEGLPRAAAELVAKRVDVILTIGPEGAVAAARATQSIPIVFWGVGSVPVELGLVTSLSRPGGNATGIAGSAGPLSVKQFELLKTIVPRATRVATFTFPGLLQTVSGKPLVTSATSEVAAAASKLKIKLTSYPVEKAEDFDSAFAAILKARAQALLVPGTRLTVLNRQRLVDFANRNRLPSAFNLAVFAEAGGLFSYGQIQSETFVRRNEIVDKILRGARPADIPVEFPNRYELVINQKTARALNLTIPQSVLLRAERVIE